MAIPEWADGQLSKALPDLLSQGETKALSIGTMGNWGRTTVNA